MNFEDAIRHTTKTLRDFIAAWNDAGAKKRKLGGKLLARHRQRRGL